MNKRAARSSMCYVYSSASSNTKLSTSALAKASSKSCRVIVSSGSTNMGTSFLLIFSNTFLCASSSIPYWIVKSQRLHGNNDSDLFYTCVMTSMRAVLLVFSYATFEERFSTFGLTLFAALNVYWGKKEQQLTTCAEPKSRRSFSFCATTSGFSRTGIISY